MSNRTRAAGVAQLEAVPGLDPDVAELSRLVLDLCERLDLPPSEVRPLAVPFGPDSDEGGVQLDFSRGGRRALFEVDGGCMMTVWYWKDREDPSSFRVSGLTADIHRALLNIKGHLIA